MTIAGQFASQKGLRSGRVVRALDQCAPQLDKLWHRRQAKDCNRLQEHTVMAARFFLPAAAFLATALQGQEPRAGEVTNPTVAGVVRDAAGLPISDVEVGIIRRERLQQFVFTAADGKFLLTGVARGMVPRRIRRLGYAMQFLDVDARVP